MQDLRAVVSTRRPVQLASGIGVALQRLLDPLPVAVDLPAANRL